MDTKELRIKLKVKGDKENVQNFDFAEFTPRIADAVLPLYAEIEKMQNAVAPEEYEGVGYTEGLVNVKDMKKWVETQRKITAVFSGEQFATFYDLCVKILQKIITYNASNKKYQKDIETDSKSDFWADQTIKNIWEGVNSFRAENYFRI
ncbi:MAG: hypothetical protein ABFC34_13980 [Methanobacterium sp.]